MAKYVTIRDRNISDVDDAIWEKAKHDAINHHMSLRAWIIFLILRGIDDKENR